MRRLIIAVIAVLMLTAVPTAVMAQHNEDPSMSGTTGLFVVPRANTLEQGRFSFGGTWSEFDHEDGDTQVHAIGIVGAFGLTDRVEIFARFEPHVDVNRGFTAERILLATDPTVRGLGLNRHPFAFGPTHPDDPYDGVGNLSVGAKVKLAGDPYEYDGISFAGWVTLPTADDSNGVGTGRFDVGGQLIGSMETWESVGWNGYVGYIFKDDPDLEDQAGAGASVNGPFFVSNEFLYGLGVHFPSRSMLQVVLESYGIVTTEDVIGAYIGGDDAFYLQGGLRLTTDSGFALSGAVNYNSNIKMRAEDAQINPDEIDDAIDRMGFLAMASYSSSRRLPVTYVGTSPMELPPVNRPPTLECRAERTTLRAGESVRLFAEVDDPDDDDVTVRWSSSAGTLSPTEGTEVTWSSEGVDPGTGPVSARASDGYGGTAECTLQLTVEAPPPPPEPTVAEFACAEFSSGSARIDNRCKAILDDVALQLRQNPGATAVIVGHSDSAGSADANTRISQERADNARTYLVETHGIDASRIETRGVGSTEPMADNSTRAGRAQNRRIGITVTIPPQ